ncbi:GumC family protein [Gelatiniphilus marinus]|uniref:GumC family protein n=1 Tax=Gelatiniphilus marinus TaxID=1759464 RepID=A0ABW5JQC6_9FLAO
MKIIEFIRLVLKHLRLLIMVPILLALLVIILTINPTFKYASQTILYTGIASGSSIEMDKKFNYQAANTAFDNLINIIISRDTQEEVAIRLLAQHLMLEKANPKYISEAHFNKLKLKIPSDLYSYVATNNYTNLDSVTSSNEGKILFPPEINPVNYEKTVKNLTALMKSSNSNFVYELLNYEHPHYSLKAISEIKAMRIANSDLIKLTYTTNDPGICQQTLALYSEVCIKNYKNIKENRSDDVVKYFEDQLEKANEKLKKAEDKLLNFNKSYNIINYYEQSKAVANVKEDMEVEYNTTKAKLAGIEATTKRLEEKLNLQEVIQQKSNAVLEKKKALGNLNYKIAITQSEVESTNSDKSIAKLADLKKQSEALSKDIEKSIDELYSYQNTVDGLPISKVLPDWMNNVVESENIKAKLKVMDQDNKKFQEQYAIYAPAGANIKRIEREISVSEQGYLEILHGLNLAKLKLQDNALSANLKTIDPPYYPLMPIPTKRKLLVIAAAFLGAILTLGILIVMEFFDNTLKNSKNASKILNLPALGMIPKVLLNPKTINPTFVYNRLIEIIKQNIIQFITLEKQENKTKTILCFSTQDTEGKTILAGNIAKALKQSGKNVLLLNYANNKAPVIEQSNFSIFKKILGAQDTRIDFENPFLEDVSNYLETSEYYTYKIDSQFYKAKNYSDILDLNAIKLNQTPDYVIIELPSIINHNVPTELFAHSDIDILICRSNRLWSEADQAALNGLLPMSGNKMHFIINGVELKEVESLLGDLPKKRTRFRKKMKTIFKFQFFTKNQI